MSSEIKNLDLGGMVISYDPRLNYLELRLNLEGENAAGSLVIPFDPASLEALARESPTELRKKPDIPQSFGKLMEMRLLSIARSVAMGKHLGYSPREDDTTFKYNMEAADVKGLKNTMEIYAISLKTIGHSIDPYVIKLLEAELSTGVA